MTRHGLSKKVDLDLAIALRQAEPHAQRLVSMNGVHPVAGSANGKSAVDAAQDLAGVHLTDDNDERFKDVLHVVEHAYVVGVAVGLKLRGMGGA